MQCYMYILICADDSFDTERTNDVELQMSETRL